MGNRNYDLSFWGEFVDKGLEKEFFDYEIRRYAKLIGPVVLIFGVIYMMFLISDYFAIENPFSFMMILIVRVLFLSISVFVYFAVKKMNHYNNLVYVITIYEILAIIGYFVIIEFYESLSLLLFLSAMSITLALFIMPNKLIHVQIISTFLSIFFFVFYAKHIDNMEASLFLKLIAYNLIIICYCNIGAYLNNFHKRKQFVYSRELLRVSITDPLTGIYNRAKFNEELQHWTNLSCRNENPLSLVMLDVDDFKRINDEYGHLFGDTILQDLALTIKKGIRETDIFARWGGEEFIILLPETDIHQAIEFMERIRILIQNHKYDKNESITCSFGLVALRKNETAASMLQRADKLLYDAKDCGKNVVVYDTSSLEQIKIALS